MAIQKKTTKTETNSPAYTLVAHVWRHKQEATSHSWQRVNAAMSGAVSLAIEAGLRFAPEDFKKMCSSMNSNYWFGGERYYTVAVEYGNTSACVSYEKLKNRPPFFFGGGRLAVGSSLQWADAGHVTVTSFADDGASLVACAYDHSKSSKPKRRLTITIDEMKEAEKKRKAVNEELRDVATLREELRRASVEVDTESVAAWTKEQRAEALAWAEKVRAAWRGASSETPDAPAFVRQAERKAAAASKARKKELDAVLAKGRRDAEASAQT